MSSHPIGKVLWARPRKPKTDIFWPAKVVETVVETVNKKNVLASVMFLGEDTYEDVKQATDLLDWDCPKQPTLISKGASITDPEKKLCFTKGVAQAKRIMGNQAETAYRRSPRHHQGKDDTKSPGLNAKRKIFPEMSPRKQKTSTASGMKMENDPDISGNIMERLQNITSKDINTDCDKQQSMDSSVKRKSVKRKTIAEGESNSISAKKRPKSATKIRETKSLSSIDTLAEQTAASTNNSKTSQKGKSNDNKRTRSKSDNAVKNVSKSVEKSTSRKSGKTVSSKSRKKPVSADSHVGLSTNGNGCPAAADDDEFSSDEELMEELLASPDKVKYNLNDVVWGKLNRDPYWPAVIKRMIKSKTFLKFLGYDTRTYMAVRRIEPFSCDSRDKFIDEARKYNSQTFEEAFVLAEDLVRKKALGLPLSDEEGDDFEYELQDEAASVPEPDAVVVEMEEKEEGEGREIRRSGRQRRQFDQYNDIVVYIKQAKPVLRQIMQEKRPSERVNVYRRGTQKQKDQLKRRSGFGPIKDTDVCVEIMEVLRDLYREVTGTDKDFKETTYIYDVLLPEAMLQAIQERNRVNRKQAEQIYLD